MSLLSWFGLQPLTRRRPVADRRLRQRRAGSRLQVELLEDRCLLAAGLSAALVADIVPGAASSNPHNLTKVNGTLFFGTANSGTTRLYKSDGTAAGTVVVKDDGFYADAYENGGLREFTPFNGGVFFTEFLGGMLWKSDGTTAGTVRLGIHAEGGLTVVNGKVFFSSHAFPPNGAQATGYELFVSDGTTAGTKLVKDIYPGRYKEYGIGGSVWRYYDSDTRELTDLNGTLVFSATNGKNGRELWRSDGTAHGTKLVKDLVLGETSSNPQHLTVMNGAVYFAAAGGLWKSDGTAAGTVLVKNVGATNLVNVNGTLFFTGRNGTSDSELWKSNGTTAGTVLVKDLLPGSAGADLQHLTNVNGTLYFSADAGGAGYELWKSDGTATGTVLVKDITPGAGSSTPYSFTNVNGLVYFSADDGTNGRELWQSDGTSAGTLMVQDIFPGSSGSGPEYLVALNNKLYFAATDPVHGRELWDPPAVEPPAAEGIPTLGNLDLRAADLGGKTKSLASGHTNRLDGAAGWVWSLAPTPWDDSGFPAPGAQGERHRMDLFTFLAHEVGQKHEANALMGQTCTAGSRRVPGGDADTSGFASDALFALLPAEAETV